MSPDQTVQLDALGSVRGCDNGLRLFVEDFVRTARILYMSYESMAIEVKLLELAEHLCCFYRGTTRVYHSFQQRPHQRLVDEALVSAIVRNTASFRKCGSGFPYGASEISRDAEAEDDAHVISVERIIPTNVIKALTHCPNLRVLRLCLYGDSLPGQIVFKDQEVFERLEEASSRCAAGLEELKILHCKTAHVLTIRILQDQLRVFTNLRMLTLSGASIGALSPLTSSSLSNLDTLHLTCPLKLQHPNRACLSCGRLPDVLPHFAALRKLILDICSEDFYATDRPILLQTVETLFFKSNSWQPRFSLPTLRKLTMTGRQLNKQQSLSGLLVFAETCPRLESWWAGSLSLDMNDLSGVSSFSVLAERWPNLRNISLYGLPPTTASPLLHKLVTAWPGLQSLHCAINRPDPPPFFIPQIPTCILQPPPILSFSLRFLQVHAPVKNMLMGIIHPNLLVLDLKWSEPAVVSEDISAILHGGIFPRLEQLKLHGVLVPSSFDCGSHPPLSSLSFLWISGGDGLTTLGQSLSSFLPRCPNLIALQLYDGFEVPEPNLPEDDIIESSKLTDDPTEDDSPQLIHFRIEWKEKRLARYAASIDSYLDTIHMSAPASLRFLRSEINVSEMLADPCTGIPIQPTFTFWDRLLLRRPHLSPDLPAPPHYWP